MTYGIHDSTKTFYVLGYQVSSGTPLYYLDSENKYFDWSDKQDYNLTKKIKNVTDRNRHKDLEKAERFKEKLQLTKDNCESFKNAFPEVTDSIASIVQNKLDIYEIVQVETVRKIHKARDGSIIRQL